MCLAPSNAMTRVRVVCNHLALTWNACARTSHCDLLQTSCQPPPYPVTERVCALLLGCCRGVLFVITFAICDSPGMQPSGTILCPHPRSLAVLRMIKAIAQPWPCMVNAWPMHGQCMLLAMGDNLPFNAWSMHGQCMLLAMGDDLPFPPQHTAPSHGQKARSSPPWSMHGRH